MSVLQYYLELFIYVNIILFSVSIIGIIILKKTKNKKRFLNLFLKKLIWGTSITTFLFVAGILFIKHKEKKNKEQLIELISNKNSYIKIKCDSVVVLNDIKIEFPKNGNYIKKEKLYFYYKKVNYTYKLWFTICKEKKVANIENYCNNYIKHCVKKYDIIDYNTQKSRFPKITKFEQWIKKELIFEYKERPDEFAIIYMFNYKNYTYTLDIATRNLDFFTHDITNIINSTTPVRKKIPTLQTK